MPITNSTYTTDNHTQADGSRWVKETHTDQNDKKYLVRYLARPEADLDEILAKHATEMQVSLGEFEADKCVDSILKENADMMTMMFVFTTCLGVYEYDAETGGVTELFPRRTHDETYVFTDSAQQTTSVSIGR